MLNVDLHVHTAFSDGLFSIEKVLELASNLRISEIAIADHDTIINLKGYSEVFENRGIRFVPAFEGAANFKGMHILGYGIKNFELIENTLLPYRIMNNAEVENVINTLNLRRYIDFAVSDVKADTSSLLLTKQDLLQYLVKNGYACGNREAMHMYFNKQLKTNVSAHKMEVADLISLINSGGGVAVLAHPHTLPRGTNFDELIPCLLEYGLKGIETHNTKYTADETAFFSGIAKKYGLVETAGSDFHNPKWQQRMGVRVDECFLDGFHAILE